jgi:hypothetical protein
MRVRLVFSMLAVAASLACSAQAQCKYDPIGSFFTDFQRNNLWPEPFVCPDRMAVRAPFEVMVRNGWIQQNMLGEHHFNNTDSSLNESGRLKLQWILTEAPPQHRTVYVRRGVTPEATVARIAAVRQAAAQLAGPSSMPEVVETTISPAGWPASRVDAIDRAFQQSTPAPRLSTNKSETSPK